MAFLCTAVAGGDTHPAGARRARAGAARGVSLSLELSLWGDAPAIRKKSRISSLAYLRGFDFALLFILNTYK